MKLWLVRHAQPLVDAGICYGRLDVAADAAATAVCAGKLAQALPAGISVIASPLQRCEQLRQALQAERSDLIYKTDPRLQEMNFGRWEGCAWTSIDRAELQAWTTDFADFAAGHDGESVTGFMGRVGLAFDELGAGTLAPALSQRAREEDINTQSNVLWITHAGVIRAAKLLAQGIRHIRHARQWPLETLKYGQWRILDLPTG